MSVGILDMLAVWSPFDLEVNVRARNSYLSHMERYFCVGARDRFISERVPV